MYRQIEQAHHRRGRDFSEQRKRARIYSEDINSERIDSDKENDDEKENKRRKIWRQRAKG